MGEIQIDLDREDYFVSRNLKIELKIILSDILATYFGYILATAKLAYSFAEAADHLS